MHDFRVLRRATREAIRKSDITPLQRLQYRGRLASCDADSVLEMLCDELIDREVLPLGYGQIATNGELLAPQAIDIEVLIAAIIEIINMLSDK